MVLAALVLNLAAAAPAHADQAAALFDPAAVSVTDIELSQESIDALATDPTTYVPGSLSVSAGGVAHGPLTVGVRLKGQGSFRPLTEKASFKIKVNWVSGQKLLGLKKLTLNNMEQDPSRVHELLGYRLFAAMDVPAPRTGFTFVTLNGEDYGLHANVETYDDVSLKRLFPDTGHLYEGGYGSDVLPRQEPYFEVDEGEATNRGDLTRLIAAAHADVPLTEAVADVADLPAMVRMWATESYIGHWDGYGVSPATPFHWPNNFYLHADRGGRFSMLPTGIDQTFSPNPRVPSERPPIGTGSAYLVTRCRADPECRRRFDAALLTVQALATDPAFAERARDAHELLRPYVARDSRASWSAAEVDAAVGSALAFLRDRPDDVAAYLRSVPTPTPAPVPAPSPVVDAGPAVTETPSPDAVPSPPPPPARPPFAPRTPTGTRCVVPKLMNTTLAVARARLKAGRCATGRITYPRHRRASDTLVVAGYVPKAGTYRPRGTRVTLVLRRRR